MTTVEEWLASIGLEEYLTNFVEEGYEHLDYIHDLTEGDLKDLGITRLGHVKMLLHSIKKRGDIPVVTAQLATPDRQPLLAPQQQQQQQQQQFFPPQQQHQQLAPPPAAFYPQPHLQLVLPPQPPQHQNNEYDQGLFECDAGELCLRCFVPLCFTCYPCNYYKAVARATGTDSCSVCCLEACLPCGIGAFCSRNDVENKYRIDGDECITCFGTVCCNYCHMAQVTHEVEFREGVKYGLCCVSAPPP